MELRAFLFDHVYNLDNRGRSDEPRALELVGALFTYYTEYPEALPHTALAIAAGDEQQAAVDYVASMTDNYATAEYERLFG